MFYLHYEYCHCLRSYSTHVSIQSFLNLFISEIRSLCIRVLSHVIEIERLLLKAEAAVDFNCATRSKYTKFEDLQLIWDLINELFKKDATEILNETKANVAKYC
jgi:hypothetical protein